MKTLKPLADANAEALRVSELRYRRLFETAQDGILILDAETGMVVDVNPFLIGLLGLSREVFLGRKVWELGFFRDIAANEAKFAELQAQKYVRYENLPLETADGRQIAVEFVSNVYLVNRKKVIQCNIRDISARKRAEDALHESGEQFRAMFEVASIGMAQADPQTGRWLRVNPKMCMITGFSEKEMLATRVSDLTHLDDREREWDAFQRVVRGEAQDCRMEVRYVRKDGAVILVNVNRTVVRDAAGRSLRTMTTVEDITERSRLEAEILKISEREQCRVGQDLHDGICQELTGIGLLAQALKRDLVAERLSPAAASADAETISNLIREAARQTHNLASGLYPVGIEEYGLISALKKLAADTALRFQITCKFKCAAPVALADNRTATHLYRIAQEAVSNAIKHGAASVVVIKLYDRDGLVTLAIEDNGSGRRKEIKTCGMGLKTMNYRARSIGGLFELRQRQGRGLLVKCSFPNYEMTAA